MAQSIYPCIWYDGTAKEAAVFYCSLFANSKITIDTPMVVNFELEGKQFMGLNGGPIFKINPSISLFVTCQTREETETLYHKLRAGGSDLMALGEYPWSDCYAWVKDRFGLTWQLMKGTLPAGMPKIIPDLLFSDKQFGNATKAISFYTSVFPSSKAHEQQLFGKDEPQAEGNLKFGHFTLNGELFAAMDGPGDHHFGFNEALSFVINCKDQQEIDYYWEKLCSNGGAESQCGWLKDQFGVSWQVIPAILGELMSDPQCAQRVMPEILKMKKLDIETLLKA